jgi:hypothetical protein
VRRLVVRIGGGERRVVVCVSCAKVVERAGALVREVKRVMITRADLRREWLVPMG